MGLFWQIMKEKKERKQVLKNNIEWKELMQEEEEENEQENELKNDSLLNSIMVFLQAYNGVDKNNKILFLGKNKLICSLLEFINFPNQTTSNLVISCIISAAENN